MALEDELLRQARTAGLPPLATPEQMAQRRAAESLRAPGQALAGAADAVGGLYRNALGAATVVPRTIAGVVSGDIPVNVQHLPDYGVGQRRAQQWVENNPEQAADARGFGNYLSDRAAATAIDAVRAAPRAMTLAGPPTPLAPNAAPAAPARPAGVTTVGQGLNGAISAQDQAVLAADRANLQRVVDSYPQGAVGGVPAPAQPATPVRSQTAERGKYTQYNTQVAPRPVGNGLDFGFGAGGETARQYLDRMSAMDAQTTARRQAAGQAARDGLERSRLEGLMTSDDPYVRRAGRELLAAQVGDAQLGVKTAAELEQARMGVDGELARADLQGRYGLADRNLANQGALASAQTSGAAGLARAQYEAQQRVLAEQVKAQVKAASPAEQALANLRTLQAQQLAAQQGAYVGLLQQGQLGAGLDALNGRAPRAPEIRGDALSGYYMQDPYTGAVIPVSADVQAEVTRNAMLAAERARQQNQ